PLTGALSKYNPSTNDFTNFTYDPEDSTTIWTSSVRGLGEDSQGNFYVGTTKGLQKMDRKTGTFERMANKSGQPYAPGAGIRENPAVYSILKDQQDGLWVGTVGNNFPTHLLRYDPNSKSAQVLPLNSSAWNLGESSDGTIWVAGAGVSGKVFRIKPKAKTYDLQQGEFLKSDFEKTSFFNQYGFNKFNYNLWGPWNMAIDSLTGDIWCTVTAVKPETRVRGWNETHHFLTRHNPSTKQTTFFDLTDLNISFDRTIESPTNQFGFIGMALDKRGRVWSSFPSDSVGIFSFDPKTQVIQHFRHDPLDSTSISSDGIVSMIMDRRGEIWLAAYDQGLNRFNTETGKTKRYTLSDPIGMSRIDLTLCLMEDHKGNIWVGGELDDQTGYYLAVVDPLDDTIVRKHYEQTANFTAIRQISQSTNGGIAFIMAGFGIGYYDGLNDNFRFIGANNIDQIPFNNIAGIVSDNLGNWWVSNSNNGSFFRMEDTPDLYSNYQVQSKSGLSSSHRGGIKAPNGNIIFPNFGSWTEIDPNELAPDKNIESTKVKLVDLFILGEKQKPNIHSNLPQPIWMMNEIELAHTAQTFGFQFTDFDFQSAVPRYQYRLHPYEMNWEETHRSPSANYFKVPPGEYQFQVRSTKNTSKTSNQVNLKVVILPPWWKTWWAYILYGIAFILMGWQVHRYQRAQVIKAERERTRQKELEHAKEIEKAYGDLKATQAQLIQSEKMASLGELTAGIAHEIQNPLNFVNNFSEVSGEMLDEALEELTNTPLSEQGLGEAKEILGDLKQNLKKIHHHGGRADSIVKGMLQHSQSSSGEKEPTDINELADEYLRLAYHGLRAKDPTFNAAFETNLDPDLPKINVIPQDIGRVLLNLINNAFQACAERSRSTVPSTPLSHQSKYQPQVTITTKRVAVPPSGGQGAEKGQGSDTSPHTPHPEGSPPPGTKREDLLSYDTDYHPKVSLTTQQLNDSTIQITISDNGPGIPDSVKDKIFQPFFTTKPTGQGTGLGLSLSYDIVKAHGGEITVTSKEGEGTEFMIKLPL
ncbi:MAG: hypothetical protein KJP00_05885, partial [Bacteroidia bacterium]|nr:hypothetical protein [Bacteroidia bacterium]